MSKFGYSYPPGCSGTPADDPDPPCEVCGSDPSSCQCQECPVCGVAGRLQCESECGLIISDELKAQGQQRREQAAKELAQLIEWEREEERMFENEAAAEADRGVWNVD